MNSFIHTLKNATLIAMALGLGFTSCKKDDDDDDTSSSHSFQSRVVEGKIEGEPWKFVAGKFEFSNSFNSDGEYRVELMPIIDTNMCSSFFFGDTDRVFFTAPLTAGLYRLNLDFSGNTESYTVTLFENESFNNIICSEGAYEIVSVDTALGTMELKIDARYDDNNFINGTCTVDYCR